MYIRYIICIYIYTIIYLELYLMIKSHVDPQKSASSQVGASVLSVLTEPKWFKGSLEDLRQVRMKTQELDGVEARDVLFDSPHEDKGRNR
jgi:hypothetical protein